MSEAKPLYSDPEWTGKIKVTKKGDRLDFNDQTWVAWEDYLALQAALREALDGWWECRGDLEQTGQERAIKRIAELRKFLDDK